MNVVASQPENQVTIDLTQEMDLDAISFPTQTTQAPSQSQNSGQTMHAGNFIQLGSMQVPINNHGTFEM